MINKGALGAALRAIRIHKQIPQEALGPSQSFISSIERGIRSPTLEKLEQLAAALNVSSVTLLAYAHLQNDETVDMLLTRVGKELRELGK